MEEIKLINIKEEILSENKGLADVLRKRFFERGILFINIMSSPGSGKTSLITKTIGSLKHKYKIAVIEADIDSIVDAKKISEVGVPVIQMHTGGFCHVDANMVEKAIESIPLDETDLLMLENVGNLVCPAETDTGAHKNIAILSLPEGDDKPLKYPLMFSVCDVLVINKLDYQNIADFNLELVKSRVKALNADINLIPLSCKTSAGTGPWINWLENEIQSIRNKYI